MGSNLCEQCTAACCRYLAIPLDTPTNARDYDDMRWYLMHEDVLVFVEDGDWFIQFQTPCKKIGADSHCAIYETRPEICREYQPKDCDYSVGGYGYDHFFTHAKQIEEFYKNKTGRKLPMLREGSGKRRPKRQKQKTV